MHTGDTYRCVCVLQVYFCRMEEIDACLCWISLFLYTITSVHDLMRTEFEKMADRTEVFNILGWILFV